MTRQLHAEHLHSLAIRVRLHQTDTVCYLQQL